MKGRPCLEYFATKRSTSLAGRDLGVISYLLVTTLYQFTSVADGIETGPPLGDGARIQARAWVDVPETFLARTTIVPYQ